MKRCTQLQGDAVLIGCSLLVAIAEENCGSTLVSYATARLVYVALVFYSFFTLVVLVQHHVKEESQRKHISLYDTIHDNKQTLQCFTG